MDVTYTDPGTDEVYPLDAVNEHLKLTIRQILDLEDCACGHAAIDHMGDGPLGPGGVCEWVWGDRSCFCRGYRHYEPDPDEPADIPDYWEE